MGRIKELDGLRGVAISLVLAWHFTGMLMNPGDGLFQRIVWRFAIFGQSGVDLFFVLSGFLIVGILVDNRESSNLFTTFYLRRALRILPPYLLLLAAFVICTAAFGQTAYLGDQLPLKSLLTFTQNWYMSDAIGGLGPGGIGGTWSLAIEEQFYLFAPALIFLLPRRYLWQSIVVIGMASTIARSVYFSRYPADLTIPYVLTPFRLEGLCAGALVALAYRSRIWEQITSHRALLLGLAAALLAIAPFYTWLLRTEHGHAVLYHFGHSYLAVLYSVILINVLVQSGSRTTSLLRSSLLTGAGAISYSLYLFHTAFKGMFFGLAGYPETLRDWSDAGLLLLALLSTVAFCVALYRLLERPAQKLGKKFHYGSNIASAPQTA